MSDEEPFGRGLCGPEAMREEVLSISLGKRRKFFVEAKIRDSSSGGPLSQKTFVDQPAIEVFFFTLEMTDPGFPPRPGRMKKWP